MYNEDDDDDDSLIEEQISRALHNDQINTAEISRQVAGEIIQDLLEKIFPNCEDSEQPQERLGFSDNFIDVYQFSGSRDKEEDTEAAIIKSPELLERNFTNIFQSCDEDFSSQESGTDSESSDSERGRVYKVNDEETDESEGDCFYSSEDLILNFVKEEEEEEEDNKNNNEEESESLVSLEIQDKDQLQVEKHVLKFELSKQLFQGKEDVKVEIPRQESSDILKERKRKLNDEVFANLFDYELQQVEEIKLGPSLASRTLAETNLLKLEKNLCVKRRRPFCYEDIFSPRRPGDVLSRSQSQPNIDWLTEEDPRSSSSSEPTTVRPILKKSSAGLVLSSSGSQTDITALRSGSKSESSLASRSSSVTFLLPSNR